MRKALTLIAAGLLASVAPATAQEVTGFLTLEQMQEAVARMREQLYTPGDPVAGWNRGGADPDAVLREAGADRFYYQIHGTGGDGVAILGDRPFASLAPAGWRVVDTYGDSAAQVRNPVIQFEALSDRYIVAVRAGTERRNGVDCVDSITNATLYERPDRTPRPNDADIPLFFRLALLASEGQTVCTRYEGSRATGWQGRSFNAEGRRLPGLDDEFERITIIPAAPIEGLIVYRQPPAQGPNGT